MDGSEWLPDRLARGAKWLPAAGERPEGWYISAGGNVGKTVASLRFCHEDLDPDEVTRLLGCQPTLTYRKGDPVSKDGRGRHRRSFWGLDSELPGSASLDAHIAHLAARVSDNPEVWHSLSRFMPDVFCGLFLSGFNQGDTLSTVSATVLASRGIALGLDIYSHSDED